MPATDEPLAARLLAERPELKEGRGLAAEVRQRLDRFGRISPLYRSLLLKHPGWLEWLEIPPLPLEEMRPNTIFSEWSSFQESREARELDILSLLRLFRRRMSMRIAYRDINNLQVCAQTILEVSLLAEFCIRECYLRAEKEWLPRYGQPWDEDTEKPARFCILALGKLGGRELNFSSDIDLIYFFEGEGFCQKDGHSMPYTNAQFFGKVAETLTNLLQEQTEHGFLFRVDLRLRPEGARSPLVRSFSSMENYYAAAGQSWERMALIKARPVAGDFSLGGELLESLHSFRYPRHPPPALLSEIAAMKLRTENEVVGSANLKRNVKSGYGGIREIEFVVQTLQLLHAGRFPFLQTHSTIDGLEQLVRYELMTREEAGALKDAYWFLRSVEHRLQIREEQQRHTLPTEPGEIRVLAESFGFPEPAPFLKKLEQTRETVRQHYSQLLRSSPVDEEMDEWWAFFAEKAVTPRVEKCLSRWFASDQENAEGAIRDFVQGDRNRILTREQVSRFTSLAKRFDQVFPPLAHPLATLKRISRFADAYGPRSHFLSACSLNPSFLEVLALLFDRSDFIHELIRQHPEILEEVLRPEILRRSKSQSDTLRELERGAAVSDEDFAQWLWLYVKAEQVRIAIGDLLGLASLVQTEKSLSLLSDAVLNFLLRRFDPGGDLLVVALGKYGGGELTFGSDLDILFLGTGNDKPREEKAARKIVKLLSTRNAQGRIYEIDLRLRPHGKDGPLTPGLPALNQYFERKAQAWEKQVLTRSRPVGGNAELRAGFTGFVEKLIYQHPPGRDEFQELWQMRRRIERERDRAEPPQRAFKTGPGGLIDIEFFGQMLQLRHGHEQPRLREQNTRALLEAIGELELMDPDDNRELAENFDFLKQVELLLRRNKNAPVSIIPATEADRLALARWAGFGSYERFWEEHVRRMSATRRIVASFLRSEFKLATD